VVRLTIGATRLYIPEVRMAKVLLRNLWMNAALKHL